MATVTTAGIAGGPSEPAETLVEGGEVTSQGSVLRLMARTFLENKLAIVGLVIVVAIVLFCFVGPVVYHTNQTSPNLIDANNAPGSGALLGNDDNGFDILGRLMVGGQSSIEIGLAVAAIA